MNQLVSLVVPRGPVAAQMPTHDFFVNRELLPLLSQMRTGINLGQRFDVRQFGAVAGSSNDQSAAFQNTIEAAKEEGRSVYVPGGIWRIEVPLDLRGFDNLAFFGDHWATRIDNYTGAELFNCLGTSGICFANFYTLAPQAKPATTAFLFGRVSVSSAGVHTLDTVRAEGWYTHATVVSMSSERNSYRSCIFDNRQAGDAAHPERSWVISCTPQNDTGIVPTYGTLANPQIGGNTALIFTDCAWTYFGTDNGGPTQYGGCMRIGGRQINVSGNFFTVRDAGQAGLLAFDCSGLSITGGTGETDGADNGVVIQGELGDSVIDGFNGNSIYGADASLVRNCDIRGFFQALDAVDLYDVIDTDISSRLISVTVRNSAVGTRFTSVARGGGAYTLPPDVNAIDWTEQQARSDGRTIFRRHIGDTGSGDLGFRTRLELGQARAFCWQTQQQTLAGTPGADITPLIRSGAFIFVPLTGNITFRAPTDMITNGTTDFDAGVEFNVIFQQDAAGGRTVTLLGYTAVGAGYALAGGANAFTRMRVHVLDTASGVFLISNG